MACNTQTLTSDRSKRMDIVVRRNDTFSEFFTLLEDGSPFDFTNYDVALMQVKTDTELETNVLELSIVNSRITLGGSAGTVTFLVAKENMDLDPDVYIYDLEVTNTTTGERETIVHGNFTVVADNTRIVV